MHRKVNKQNKFDSELEKVKCYIYERGKPLSFM